MRLDHYYEHWLRALERLCAAKGMVDPAEIRTRQEEWRRAYLDTPHGGPVEARRRTSINGPLIGPRTAEFRLRHSRAGTTRACR